MRAIPLLAAFGVALYATGSAATEPRWTVPRLGEPPITEDGGWVLEGTSTAPPWAWHAHVGARYGYGAGLADRASQLRGDLGFGLGLPAGLEAALGMPLGWTFGTRRPAELDAGPRPWDGLGGSGPGLGDLRLAFLWSHAAAGEDGLGLLFGVEGWVPTGDHARLLGEGGPGVEPFVSLAFQVLSARASLNLGYRLRPEHRAPDEEGGFEQDDEILWRVGLRVPRDDDIAWSVEAEGAIGILTRGGAWAGPGTRPVLVGAGVDLPVTRAYRLGLWAGIGPAGEEVPRFTAALRFFFEPVLRDEDEDGVRGAADECPLLAEDRDGFEDGDGCPDLDNDSDGFPDDEDACPIDPAGRFSDDGC